MWTVPALATALGLSPWGTLRLIWRLRPLMAELCVSPPGEPFAFTPEALDLLRRARTLRAWGLPDRALARRLKQPAMPEAISA